MTDCTQHSPCMCWRGFPVACVNDGVRLKCGGSRFPFNSVAEMEHASAEMRSESLPGAVSRPDNLRS